MVFSKDRHGQSVGRIADACLLWVSHVVEECRRGAAMTSVSGDTCLS
jgi:hypothetical protein